MTFARDQKEVKEESKEICEVRFPGRRAGAKAVKQHRGLAVVGVQ